VLGRTAASIATLHPAGFLLLPTLAIVHHVIAREIAPSATTRDEAGA